MKVFHHNDIDGRCAAAIVKKMIDEAGQISFDNFDVPTFIEMDYKDRYDISQIGFCEAIVIVDFSFSPEVMNEILKQTTNVTWIDHHKTAEIYHAGYAEPVKGIQDFTTPGKSGAELTWEYFFGNKPMPRAVKLVGDYDTWRWEYGEETANFHEGLGLEDQSPSSQIWKDLLSSDKYQHTAAALQEEILKNGEIAVRYRNNFCLDYCRIYGFETEFEGYNCYALNLYRFGSLGFGEKIDFYDICISFAFDGFRWTVGLYTAKKDLDVSAIARKHGGGGHQQAAGFPAKELPFLPKEKNYGWRG